MSDTIRKNNLRLGTGGQGQPFIKCSIRITTPEIFKTHEAQNFLKKTSGFNGAGGGAGYHENGNSSKYHNAKSFKKHLSGGCHFDEKTEYHGGFGGGAVGDDKLCGSGGGYTGQ